MQENVKKYYPLGSRTLWMFVFKRSGAVFFFFAALCVALIILGYIPSEYVNVAANAVIGYVIFLLVILGWTFFIGWLQYFRYWVFVDDQDLKIAKGLFSVQQIGILYKHIYDIKIERSLLDQFFGVSNIIITVSGSEQKQLSQFTAKENTIVLPSLPKEVALEIQDSVLSKAQVDQMSLRDARKV